MSDTSLDSSVTEKDKWTDTGADTEGSESSPEVIRPKRLVPRHRLRNGQSTPGVRNVKSKDVKQMPNFNDRRKRKRHEEVSQSESESESAADSEDEWPGDTSEDSSSDSSSSGSSPGLKHAAFRVRRHTIFAQSMPDRYEVFETNTPVADNKPEEHESNQHDQKQLEPEPVNPDSVNSAEPNKSKVRRPRKILLPKKLKLM